MHDARAPRAPRLQLFAVTLLALASLSALLGARPALGNAIWSHGDDLAIAVAWIVAVAASAWLFVATATCVLALRFTRPRSARRAAQVLPIGLRRLVEVAIVGSCIALPALPAHAAPLAPLAPASAVVRADQPVVRAPEPASVPVAAPTPTSTPTPTPAPVSAAGRVVVAPGDNLWLIARASVAHASGTTPTDAETARYWHAVIAANRSTLRSGDPSVIFPGEIVTLPPPATVP